jgi:outer membrane receptor for ferrienterochelin and colicin
VARAGYDAPTPTTVIGDGDLKKRGITNVADMLNTVPAFGNSSTPSTSALFAERGRQFFNLRGLGANRTLVLVDGQRFVPPPRPV